VGGCPDFGLKYTADFPYTDLQKGRIQFEFDHLQGAAKHVHFQIRLKSGRASINDTTYKRTMRFAK
jgi:hypothetical protein